MEEIISLILNGCKLAKELEANQLPNITNRPDMILKSCDHIINMFLAARERLNNNAPAAAALATLFNYPVAAAGDMVFHEQQVQGVQQQQQQQQLQEWLRSSVTQAMEREMEGTTSMRSIIIGGEHHGVLAMDVQDSTRGSSSSQARHRKNENARRVKVPAPQIGNTEIPPEDGHTWRKYGQKEILNTKYPRSYYRCTHQKLYNCPAKKQVQRLDDDPFTFGILYRGDHTCHMSLTAPSSSVPPPPPPPPPPSTQIIQELTHDATMQGPSSRSNVGPWLSIDAGASGSAGVGAGTGAGDHNFVANMADALFNSGSSSSNSMEFLFHSSNNKEDKWNQEEKNE